MRIKLVVTGIAAVLLASLSFTPASADHSWGPYHWARTSNPFTLEVGDNVTSVWDSYLRTSDSDWSRSSVLDLSIVRGGTKPRNCKATTGMVEVCNARYGNTGWLGVAGISITGGEHITSGYVKLNDTFFDTPQYDTAAWRNLVMCQEIGHTFGLDHQDENFDNPNLGTCMDYASNPGTNQHPNAHDYSMLEQMYEHTDSFDTVGVSKKGRGNGKGKAVGNTPASWGKKVDGSRGEGHSTYVRKDGPGRLQVTFVTWA